ncbi:MAG: glycosyltransferase family 4 protein [candidate division Zixibacteria bacterium]|nr:glycosyltransferase family 4 protein [candidate division Zixibacteria bacterium]
MSTYASGLKILILTHNYIRFPGDHAGLFVHILAKGLVRCGHKVFVLAPHQKGLKRFEMMDDVAVYRFRYAPAGKESLAYIGNMHELVARSWINKFLFLSFLVSFFVKALTLSLKEKIDLIWAQWWIPGGLIGYSVSLLSQEPLMVTSHGTDIRILEKTGLPSRLAGLVFGRAKYVTTVSSFLKEKLNKSIKLAKDKVKVIPMPVIPETFTPTPLKAEAVKLILCVARFTPQKGLNFFLKACKILKEKGIGFQAKIVGEGPLKNFLQQQILTLNLEDRVFLLDIMPQRELNLLYAESYLCVLSSLEEGFGLVLVEAQLCKRPIIGTKSGGIPDIIEDEVTGLLVPPGDHLSLASAMERILADEKLAGDLAEAGFRSALEKFSPETIQAKYLELLT